MGAIKVNVWCRLVTSRWRLKPSVQGSSCTAGIIQSARVITAQSAQTPSVRHTWGPAIRSDTPNGYQGCRAAINYYSSTLTAPLLPLSVFFSPFFSSFVFSPAVLSPEHFSFVLSGPRFALWHLSDSAEQRRIHTSPKGRGALGEKVEGEALRWKAIVCVPPKRLCPADGVTSGLFPIQVRCTFR